MYIKKRATVSCEANSARALVQRALLLCVYAQRWEKLSQEREKNIESESGEL